MIHEQNAFPGLANRRLAQKAEAVCLTFAPAQRYFPHQERIHYTGLPVRQRIIDAGCESFKREAYAFFEIPEAEQTIPTLLITGGFTREPRVSMRPPMLLILDCSMQGIGSFICVARKIISA